MKVSAHRLDRYAAIAACGSGAVGLAVSPLHGDIQYFDYSDAEYVLSFSLTNTTESSVQSISGGGVHWGLSGFGSYFFSSTNISTFSTYGFYNSHFETSSLQVSWSVSGDSSVGSLLNAGDSIDGFGIRNPVGRIFHGSQYRYSFQFSSSSGDDFFSSIHFSSESTSTGLISRGERGFLGMSFDLDGETVFGWADISLSDDGLSLTLHGWAFEDSGAAILAGQTGDSSTPVPGLGGLAALACGAAGMRRRRDRVA